MTSHPIFDQPEEAQQTQQAQIGSRRKQRVLFRDSDMLAAMGSHIRITSLLESKLPRSQRTYKTLHTPQVQFQIEQMVLNGDGRLLAVSDSSQVSVICLPSSSRGSSKSPIIEARSIGIGTLYYNSQSSAKVVKMDWHPLADGHTSLFILTSDAILREFDPTVNTEEPLQTFHFVSQHLKKGNSFSFNDPGETEAVSFTFACGRASNGAKGYSDWTPLTIYGLMRNGDIYALCPVCPSKLRVYSSYIYSLEAYVRGKEALALNDTSLMSSSAPEFHPAHSFSSSTSSISDLNDLDLPTVYDHQRKYISTLLKQLITKEVPSQRPPSTYGLRQDSSLASDTTASASFNANFQSTANKLVTLHAPTTIKRSVESQGPFGFQPAPYGGLTEWDEMASDILYLTPFSDSSKRENQGLPAVGIMLLSFNDGRVEISLDLVKVEAIWSRPGSTPNAPFLIMLETVDLDLLRHFTPSNSQHTQAPHHPPNSNGLIPPGPLPTRFLYQNYPLFVIDPIYSDTVYIHHNLGVHAVWLGWIENLRYALKKSLEKKERIGDEGVDPKHDEALVELVKGFLLRPEGKEGISVATLLLDTVDPALRIAHPIIGLAISTDVFVDYALLAMAPNHPVVTMELPLRAPEPSLEDVGPILEATTKMEQMAQKVAQNQQPDLGKSSDAVQSKPQPLRKYSEVPKAPQITPTGESYRSYTEMRPFEGVPAYRPPRAAKPAPVVVAKDEIEPNQLRQFVVSMVELGKAGELVETMQATVQDRLYLLMAERARQLNAIKQCNEFIEKLHGVGKEKAGKIDETLTRTHIVAGVQPALIRKVDTILQKVMDGYSGQLTEAEIAWFQELKRMGKEVMLSGDGSALIPRAHDLEKQLELLMPDLKEAVAGESSLRDQQHLLLGTKQTLTIGQALGSQDAQIKEAVQKLKSLATRLGISVATPGESGTE